MCGGEGNWEPWCSAVSAKCVVCGGPNAASEPTCPIWLREKHVQALISVGWSPGSARQLAGEERGEPPLYQPTPARTQRPFRSPRSPTDLRRSPTPVQAHPPAQPRQSAAGRRDPRTVTPNPPPLVLSPQPEISAQLNQTARPNLANPDQTIRNPLRILKPLPPPPPRRTVQTAAQRAIPVP